jgi:hypothetical protein
MLETIIIPVFKAYPVRTREASAPMTDARSRGPRPTLYSLVGQFIRKKVSNTYIDQEDWWESHECIDQRNPDRNVWSCVR